MLLTRTMQNEYYLGNPLVKRDGVVQDWTQEDLKEYSKCMKNPSYFAEKYVKIISLDKGMVPFELYPYQKKMFSHFNDNRFSIVLACRQSGKSISACAYLLWFALFNSDKTIAVMANKGATAREMLGRITLMLENLPFFIQPGCKSLNKGSIEFSNNSRIVAAATSGSSIRGMSVNLLYLDEFAFVERAAEFYTSTYPVVSAGKDTKIIVTSTANGVGNVFYNIWQGAEQNVNQFKSFRVDWWDVPGRDEQWKISTIANTSQLQFDQEFGNTFFGTGDTLINAETLMKLKAKNPIEALEGGNLLVYEKTEKNHSYIMTVDVSKGRGQDYSTFTIIDISTSPFRQVAVYRNNVISPILYPNIIYKFAKVYNDAYIVVEANDQGSIVCNGLYHDFEYEHMYLESAVKADKIGVEINRKSKRIGCSSFKDLLENNKLEIVDQDTIVEISTFEAKGQSYEATQGNHDDLVMNLVLFGYFVYTEAFQDLSDINLKEMLFEDRMKQIEEDVVPFGFHDDGSAWVDEEDRKSQEWFITYDYEREQDY